MNASGNSGHGAHSAADTQQRLIKAAVRLFARRGFDGTSVKELADEAGVNISLVSYHFGGKEGLYRECLERAGKERLAVAQRILTPPRTAEEFEIRLRMSLEEILNFHVEEPEICTIIQREIELEANLAQDIFQRTFLKGFETFRDFIVSAQKIEVVRKDFDPVLLASMFYGALFHFGRMDKVGEQNFGTTVRNPKHRAQVLDTIMNSLLNGCLTQTSNSKVPHPGK